MNSTKKDKKKKSSLTSCVTVERPLTEDDEDTEVLTVTVGCGSSGFTTTVCPTTPAPRTPPIAPSPEVAAAAVSEHLRRHGRLLPSGAILKNVDKKNICRTRMRRSPSPCHVAVATQKMSPTEVTCPAVPTCSLPSEIPLISFNSHTSVIGSTSSSYPSPTSSLLTVQNKQASADFSVNSSVPQSVMHLQSTAKNITCTSKTPHAMNESRDPNANIGQPKLYLSTKPTPVRHHFPLPNSSRVYEDCNCQQTKSHVENVSSSSHFIRNQMTDTEDKLTTSFLDYGFVPCHVVEEFIPLDRTYESHSCISVLTRRPLASQIISPSIENARAHHEASISSSMTSPQYTPSPRLENPRGHHAPSFFHCNQPHRIIRTTVLPDSMYQEEAVSHVPVSSLSARRSYSSSVISHVSSNPCLQPSTHPCISRFPPQATSEKDSSTPSLSTSSEQQELEEESSSEQDVEFLPLLLMRLNSKFPQETLLWFLEQLERLQAEDGSGLLIMIVPSSETKIGVRLLLSATTHRLLEAAKSLALIKRTMDGPLKQFMTKNLDCFLTEAESPDDFLSTAEKQLIFVHLVRNLRFTSEEQIIPGKCDSNVYPNESIVLRFVEEKLVERFYPLHEPNQLCHVCCQWWFSILFRDKVLDDIRLYYGESVAFHFAFLAFLGQVTAIHGLFGLVLVAVSGWPTEDSLAFVIAAALNIVVGLLFPLKWRWKSSRLAFKWGTLRHPSRAIRWTLMDSGGLTDSVMDRPIRCCVILKMCLLSFPLLGLYQLLAFWVLNQFISFEKNLDFKESPGSKGLEPWIVHLAAFAAYAFFVCAMTWVGSWLCSFCTNLECHYSNKEHELNRVFKIIIMLFLLNFSAIVYFVFILHNLKKAALMLIFLLTVMALLNLICKGLLKLFFRHCCECECNLFCFGCKQSEPTREETWAQILDSGISAKALVINPAQFNESPAKVDETLKPYQKSLEDEGEAILLFGLAFLFSPVFPVASLLVLLNVVILIQTEEFALCRLMQRPLAQKVENFGHQWQAALDLAATMVLVVNSALLSVSSVLRKSYGEDLTSTDWFLLFILIEHIVVALKLYTDIVYPNYPRDVDEQIERQQQNEE